MPPHEDYSVEQQKDIGKIWGEMRETQGDLKTLAASVEGDIRALKIIITGEDGKNGLRSRIEKSEEYNRSEHKELKEEQKEINERLSEIQKTAERAASDIITSFALLDSNIKAVEKKGFDIWEKERFIPGNCIGTTKALELNKEQKEINEKLSERVKILEEWEGKRKAVNWDQMIRWGITILLGTIGGWLIINGQALLDKLK